MNLTRKTTPLELKEATDSGYFEGYAAVYGNVDNGGDIIQKGAFTSFRYTRNGKMRIAAYHNLDRIIGLASVESDDYGLLVKGQVNLDIGYAKDVYELMRMGAIDSMSVGYFTRKSDAVNQEGRQIRVITDAELWEVSVLPFGMNPEASILDVKSDKRTFETALQHRLGLSQKDAKRVTSAFFAGRDEQNKETETVMCLKSANSILDKYL